MKNNFFYTLFSALLVAFSLNNGQSQTNGYSVCFDDGDAFVGLDRKGWTSQASNLSESYQFDFEIPDPPPLECHEVAYIDVNLSLDVNLNTIESSCFLGFWTHAVLCDSNDPIGCPNNTILYDEMGLNTSFTITDDLENGENLGVDIVVLVDPSVSSCPQEAITLGMFDADVEVCIDIYYTPLDPEMEVDLGDDIIVCDGATIDIEGPNGFEEYVWDGPIDGDEQTLEDAIPGTYILDAYDALGCKSSDEIEILVASDIAIEFSLDSPFNICLPSSAPLEAIVNTIASNADFEYEWEFPDGSNADEANITLSQSGTYTLTVEDNDTGCTKTANFIVEESNAAVAQIDSISLDNLVLCENDSYIATAFVPFDDINPYSFEWIYNNDTTRIRTITINNSGTYILNMYNLAGCPSTSDTLDVEFVIPMSAGESNNITICSNETTNLNLLLSIDADLNGTWFDSNNTQLPDGIYTPAQNNTLENVIYIVENETPCENDTAFFSIFINPSSANAGDDIDYSLCHEESIDLSNLITGDSGGVFTDINYVPYSGSTVSSIDFNTPLNTIYYIVEGSTCENDTAEIQLTVFDEVVPNLIRDTYCSGDDVVIGGLIFNMANNSDIITLDGANINGCDSIIDVSLNFVDEILNEINSELCEGQSIIIEGQTFDETNPIDTIRLVNGSSLGCDSLIAINLTFSNSITENISAQLCEGDDIDINGTIYNETNSSGQQMLTTVGGCDSIINIAIDFIMHTDTLIKMELCPNDEIIVNGDVFNEQIPTGVQTLTNALGCDSIITIELTFLDVSVENIDLELCENESIDIESEIFNINNQNGMITLPGGSVSGCDSIINVSINFLNIASTIIPVAVCDDDSIFIDNQWVFQSGNYIENLNTTENCDSVVTYEVTFTNCGVDITAQSLTDVSCFDEADGSITLSFEGAVAFPYLYNVIETPNGNTYAQGTLNNNDFLIENLIAGDFEFELYNTTGMLISTYSFTIGNTDPIDVTVNALDNNCIDDFTAMISLDVVGGTAPYSFDWSSGQTTSNIENLSEGTYTYTVIDDNNCSESGSVNIISPEAIEAIITVTNTACENSASGIISIENVSGGSLSYEFSLDGIYFSPQTVFNNLEAGNYTVYVLDSNDCLAEFPANVEVESDLVIDDLLPLVINQGDSIDLFLNINFTPSQISWEPAIGISCTDCLLPQFSPNTTTEYTLTVIDEFGCEIMKSLTVEVIVPDFDQIYVPNVFNPNDRSAINNRLTANFANGANVDLFTMQIYDRWGNLIFESNDKDLGWDGRNNNGILLQGVYVYVISYQVNGGIPKTTFGDVTVIR